MRPQPRVGGTTVTGVVRSCDQHKNLYIILFLLTIFGPDYYIAGNMMMCDRERQKLVVA